MKRAVSGAATLVGLVLVVCAVMGAVLLGPDGTWHSELAVPAGRTAVVLEPALVSVLGPRITVEAQAQGAGASSAPLFAGRARPDDTAELLASTDRLDVTGLHGARELATNRHPGTEALPAPGGLDVWGSSVTGSGEVRLVYRAQRGAQSVVLARADGAPLPALALRVGWSDRTWLWVPALMLVLGLALLLGVRRWARPKGAERARSARTRRRRPAAATTSSTSPAATPTATPTVPPMVPSPGEPAAPDEPDQTTRIGRRRAATSGRRR